MRRKTITIPWPELRGIRRHLHRLLPTPGNAIFTLLVAGALLWVNSAGALSTRVPAAPLSSTSTIPYQGRLADAAGNPVTATTPMSFRLYASATGGTPLWIEQWTGSNSVQVSDGLFNVMLGSLTPLPQSVVMGNANLWLGITVNADNEMTPRVQLGSVPFAMLAQDARSSARAVTVVGEGLATTTMLYPSFTTVPSMTTQITLDEARHVTVQFSGAVTHLETAGDPVILRLVVDGVPRTQAAPYIYQAVKSVPITLHWGGELAVGEHTISVDWSVRSGTARFWSRQWPEDQPWESRILTVTSYDLEQ